MSGASIINCENCGKAIRRTASQIRSHNYCSKECSKVFTSKRMTNYNKTNNPKNTPSGWDEEAKEKARLREIRNKESKGRAYKKYYGKHEHRVNAEKRIGRPLQRGEVVHHIDGNKLNNMPENLMVFKNQKEHIQHHLQQGDLQRKDVMPNATHKQ